MKQVLAVAIATLFMLASVPAFACSGDKSAKKADGDSSVMTSVDDGAKAEDGKSTKKAKTTKKEAKKADAEEKTATEDGEV